MNKIYKVMYSKVKQCAVVVSEIAKSHGHNGESSGVRKHAALTAAVLIALGSLSFTTAFVPMTAEAADKTRTPGSNFVGVERTDGLFEDSDYANHNGQGAHGDDSITIGLKASGGDGTITIGDRRAEKSLGSVYVGRGPGMPTGKVLPDKTDDGYWATSVGYQSDATGYGSIAIGSNATANNSYDKDSTGHGITLRTTSGDGKTVVLNGKPDIQRASVAIGYGANADNGNIAIGSYSDASTDLRTAKTSDGQEIKSYLTDQKADSYVSVGKSDALRRISNVADGAADTDVATIAQLRAVAKVAGQGINAGWGIKKTDNTISVDRNLGNNSTNAKLSDTGLILGGDFTNASDYYKAGAAGKNSVTLGGNVNLASGEDSVAAGGEENMATGKGSFIGGGWTNEAKGGYSTVIGGYENKALGDSGVSTYGAASTVVGGVRNTAEGDYALVTGGNQNVAWGRDSLVSGGKNNIVLGQMGDEAGGPGKEQFLSDASAFGGVGSVVQGLGSVGLAGGSTGKTAYMALAAGYKSVVTDGAAKLEARINLVDGMGEKFTQILPDYKDVASAIGYEATANEAGTIAFGHDSGDVSGYTVTWAQKGVGTGIDDYSQAPTVTENHYDDAYYNRLVKVADAIDNHDAVTREQVQYIGGIYGTDKNDANYGGKGATGSNSIAIGSNAVAAENNVVSFGNPDLPAVNIPESQKITHSVSLNDTDKTVINQIVGLDVTNDENWSKISSFKDYLKAMTWGSATYNQDIQKLNDNPEFIEFANKISLALIHGTLTQEQYAAFCNYVNGTEVETTPAVNIPAKSENLRRVVYIADGINAHDGVAMEQLANASNVGNNIKVYKTDENGNVQFDSNNKPIVVEDKDLSVDEKNKRDAARDASKDAWGEALGAEAFKDADAAKNSTQLINGKTLYNYDAPVAEDGKELKTVSAKNTTGQNLAALDATLNDSNHNIKYYSVNEQVLPKLTLNGTDYSNQGNDGAKEMGSMAAGFNTYAGGIASTVAGSYSGVINDGNVSGYDLRGATALSYGSFNINQNTDASKAVSGVANSIIGQANVTQNSNAAIVYGAGNVVTNSYRNIDASEVDLSKVEADVKKNDVAAVIQDAQKAVPNSGGQVMVMGGGNSVDKAYMTQVVGVGNKVTGQDSTYAEKTSTQYNFVDGFQNELKNGKNDYIIGTKNKVSGDSVDKNQSNIIFGDNHTLTNTKNAVIIGSSDKVTEIAGSDAVSIGYNANAGGESVALGSNAVAGGNALAVGPYANAKNNSIALGIHASATSSQNLAIGYYANVTGRPDTIKNSVALGASSTVGEKDILSTDNGFGVLSIGAKDKERRIIHVRAGVNDTDAVNVSQLKSVQSGLTDKGLTFVTNDGEHVAKLGSKVTIQGTAKKADHEYTADNLTTEIDKDGNITILMDKDMSVEKLAVNGKPGTPGSIGVKGQDGQSGVGIDGKDGISIKGRDGKDGVTIKAVDGKDGTEGHIGLTGPAGTNGKDGTNAVDITVKNGYNTEAKDGKDGINGEKGVDGTSLTRVVYEDKNGEHQIATLEDGLKFKGDNGKEISKKLNNTLEIIGGAKGDLTEGNIGVNSTTDGKLKVQLAKDLTGLNSATYTTTTGEGESAKTSTTVVNANGLTINGGPSITNNGIDGGKKTITNVGSGIKAGTDGKYTVTDANNSNAANIGDVNNMVKQAVGELSDATKTNLAGKANVDASNLTAGDVTKWQYKLGNGKVESGNTGLVTGDTVFNAVDTKANRDGSNLTDKEADSFSEKIAKGEVKPGENRAVSGDAVSQAISKVTGDMNTKLDGKANTSLDNITKDGQTVIKKLSQDAVQVKGGTAITVDDNVDDKGNKTYMISANNNGKVEKDDGNLISGDTLYKEVHVDKDGTYIKSKDSATGKDMTVAQNLSALDTGLKTTSDLIHMNDKGDIQIGGSSKATKIDVSGKDSYGKTTGRVITGVVTDAQDASSAANVGYVNGVTAANTQQIYRDMNSAYGRLNNNINKAAAGSNALAALHPLDYDPDDKADFAVGYGHYRNANAAAVGAFYHPNENTMVNVGVSLGNGDPGFNAGVSFKVGRGGAGREAMSKTEMAKVINSQSKEIDALKKDNADKDKRIDALEQKMAEILAKLDKNGK